MDIQEIVEAITNNRIRITDHADEEAQADHLSFDEIFGSVLRGEVVEDYPDDWPYPSCWCMDRHSVAIRSTAFGPTTSKAGGPCSSPSTALILSAGSMGEQGDRMEPFDRCPVCGGELVDKEVEKLLRGGVHTAAILVHAQVCLKCGERLYSLETISRFEQIRAKLERQEVSEFQPVGQSFQVA